jgi:hypothetical protein
MTTKDFYAFLRRLDSQHRWVFTIRDLKIIFEEPYTALWEALRRFVRAGFIIHLSRGLYGNAMPSSHSIYAGESLVPYLRPLCINYESLESRLSALGIISQIPVRLTFMTSGRSGYFRSPLTAVEFTHFSSLPTDFIRHLEWDRERKIFVASPFLAFHDLKKVGRNLQLVDEEELQEAISDYDNTHT